ncbi:hypothetical protein SAMN06265337_1932 [Hymenobacter gelipurpurascens]|uniref:Uncharacterized protein n=1 Tax=Hymenobacter gelipurpurascens TaxID=89968 RepID=A0A212TNI8_9BACT|nr:hypothetical protein [Hymenobacter gelipurpurascens]SNC67384.1 hypothetical protein SAMN06265337_1932 [Hymenobacter gelipurpurascens]
MSSQYNLVEVPYYNVQPIKCEVDDFSQNLAVAKPANHIGGMKVLAQARVIELDDKYLAVHLAVEGQVKTKREQADKAFFIATTTTFIVEPMKSIPSDSTAEKEKEHVRANAISAAISLTRSHLFVRFQFTQGWRDYILPMILVR